METNQTDRLVTVEKLVYGGEGLARTEGRVTLVPFVLPGEVVRVEVTQERPALVRARARSVLEASADRQAAPCPHFGVCGGCHYQHIRYPAQLEQKRLILEETLLRIGRISPPGEIEVVSGPEMGYRNRVQLHFSAEGMGFREGSTRKVAPIDSCAVCSPALARAVEVLGRMRRDRRFPGFLQTLELFSNETETQLNVLSTGQPLARRFFEWCAAEIPGTVSGPLTYVTSGFSFRVSYNAFFQVNRFLIEPLVEAALRGAEGETALDLYSGVGLFSLPLAKRFARVTAVESGVAAWRDLEFNATHAGVALEGVQSPAEEYLRGNPASFDFVLADPPRAGLGKAVAARLLESRPKRITIVSCDPATLARDLAALAASYDLDSVTMVDLFPQTFHIETVARLRLKG